MQISFKTAKHLLSPLVKSTLTRRSWLKMFTSSLIFGGYNFYNYKTNTNAHCGFFQNVKFDYSIASKSTLVIYKDGEHTPIAGGIILSDDGLCVSISNIFPRISEDRLDVNQFKAKILGHDEEYLLNFVHYVPDENLVIFKINKRDYAAPFTPAKFSQKYSIGDNAVVIGKSSQNFNLLESGLINEVSFNPKTSFGVDNDTSSFNLMTNIPNQHFSLYGSPIFNEEGHVLGMVIPFDNKLLPHHTIAMPSNYLVPMMEQFRNSKAIRRPYLGLSIKSASSQDGAFILKLNRDGPGQIGGLKLGDTIIEVDDRKISNGSDFFKALGYELNKSYKIKVDRDGKILTYFINSA